MYPMDTCISVSLPATGAHLLLYPVYQEELMAQCLLPHCKMKIYASCTHLCIQLGNFADSHALLLIPMNLGNLRG